MPTKVSPITYKRVWSTYKKLYSTSKSYFPLPHCGTLDLPAVPPEVGATPNINPVFSYTSNHTCSQGVTKSLTMENQCSWFHHKMWSWWSFLLLRLLLPLIQRKWLAPATQAGAELGVCCFPICRLGGQRSHMELLRAGRREQCSLGRKLQAARTWWCFYPDHFVSGPTTTWFKKLRFKNISSFRGCLAKQALAIRPNISLVLAIVSQHWQKKDAWKKRKIQTETLLQSVGSAVHWALPRRAAAHWSSDLNCLDSLWRAQ